MGLVFESHEEKLLLTGVPVRFDEPDGDEGNVVLKSMIVSNDSRIVKVENLITIPLTREWYKALAAKDPNENDRLVINLVKAKAHNEVDKILLDTLSATGFSMYDIEHALVETKSVWIKSWCP